MYIDLLKKAVYGDLQQVYAVVDDEAAALVPGVEGLRTHGMRVVRERAPRDRHLLNKHSMVGRAGLNNLHSCVANVIEDDIPGDLIETGVWRGGASILMRGILAAYGVTDRTVYVADSFQGLPEPDAERYPADAGDKHHRLNFLAVDIEKVRQNFDRYGLLDGQVQFLEGWFRDTLPTVADHTWAVVRLDGDMYESTTDGLRNLYPGLSVGGYLIVDDYNAVKACAKAVEDYRAEHAIIEPMTPAGKSAVWWRRES